jgi:hypothetical protein
MTQLESADGFKKGGIYNEETLLPAGYHNTYTSFGNSSIFAKGNEGLLLDHVGIDAHKIFLIFNVES